MVTAAMDRNCDLIGYWSVMARKQVLIGYRGSLGMNCDLIGYGGIVGRNYGVVTATVLTGTVI